MSNNCQRPSGFAGVPVLDSAESFSKMGSIPGRHTELLLSWDQQLRGLMKQPPAIDLLSLFGRFRQSGLRLSWLGTVFSSDTFCCLSQFMRDWQFSSVTVCLLLCDSTSGLFLRLWPLRVNFLFPMMWLGSWGGTSAWLCPRFCDTRVSCVSSSLLSGRMLENGCSSPGDVWMAMSITLSEVGLAECSLTKVLSSFRASSTKFRSLFWSSLRHSRLFFMLCRFEPSSAVVSPFWMIKIILITNQKPLLATKIYFHLIESAVILTVHTYTFCTLSSSSVIISLWELTLFSKVSNCWEMSLCRLLRLFCTGMDE